MAVSCTLVHIHEEKNPPNALDFQRAHDWKEKLEGETGRRDLSLELVHLPENIDSVSEVLERLNADIVLLNLADPRNFFEKWRHKSLARAIILNPKVPILLTSGDTE